MTAPPIVVQQAFSVPCKVVWDAITQPDRMRPWFFPQIPDFRPDVGFETRFHVDCEGEDYLHVWKVTDVEPPARIEYDWHYEGIPGRSHVVWEVEEVPGGCRLTLTHAGGESFPQDNPVFSREAGQQGWEYFINQQLKAALEPESR